MDLPLILAGPILRRVEPNVVAVWVALRDPSTLKLALWENQLAASDATDTNLWFRSPDPGTSTVRVGEKLHIAVVTLHLPSGKTLVPERLYSYDVEITPQGQTTKSTLKSLGLLADDPERLRALVRRGTVERPPVMEVGDLRLDPGTRQVWRGEVEIDLSSKEFTLLETFMRHAGYVLSRTQLLEQAWEYDFEHRSNVVEVYVRYLRRKVDVPFGLRSIETVRGAGYRLRKDGGR